MEWTDEAILLSARPHGENASIVTLFSPCQGRHAGLVAGGQGRRARGILETGNIVQATWKARLADHLGHFQLDPIASPTAKWLDDPLSLATFSSLCAVTEASVPERQPLPGIYEALRTILSLEDVTFLGPVAVKWEAGLLHALGYGLDLSCCTVSGATTGLTHISPRTGRAVCEAAAKPYREKLLVLPGFLCGSSVWNERDVYDGLVLTGHFLSRHVFMNRQAEPVAVGAGALPFARQRLLDMYKHIAIEKGLLYGAKIQEKRSFVNLEEGVECAQKTPSEN